MPFEGYEAICDRFISAMHIFGPSHYFGETNLDDMVGHRPSSVYRPLSRVLTEAQYRRYRAKLMQILGVDLAAFEHMPPMFITSAISAMLLNAEGPSIDEALWMEAKGLSLEVDGLEPFDRQLEIYDSIPLPHQYTELKRLLGNLSRAKASLKSMTESYQREEIHALYKNGRKSLGVIRRLMLHERNGRMVDKIAELAESDIRRCFITVGAAHLSGKVGILHLLSEQGFKKSRYKD